jgi:hypothetical protein
MLGNRAFEMREPGHIEIGVARSFRVRYCATRRIDLEASY